MVRRPTLFQLHSDLSSCVGLTTNPDLCWYCVWQVFWIHLGLRSLTQCCYIHLSVLLAL